MDTTLVLLLMDRHLRTVVVVEEDLLILLIHLSTRITLLTRIYRGEVVVVVEAEEALVAILVVAAETVAMSTMTVLAITDLLPVALVTQAEAREEVDQ